jgi:hypothetical protein
MEQHMVVQTSDFALAEFAKRHISSSPPGDISPLAAEKPALYRAALLQTGRSPLW